jgi:RsiW-degrading membrane proteinase PrsW (M82 family)
MEDGLAETSVAAAPVSRPAGGLPASVAGHLAAIAVAITGGVLGIPGAIIQELQAGGFILLPIIGAPIIEEAAKPLGVYILLLKWPGLLKGRLHTALLAGLAGLTFGLIEAFAYVTLYAADPPAWFVTYRFTAPLALHTAASFIFGLGLTRGLLDWANGEAPLSTSTRNLFFVAVAMHAIFNTVALVLGFTGVFGLD